MKDATHLYFLAGPFLVLVPPLIAIGAAVTTLQMSSGRWIVHLFTFATIIFLTPLYVNVGFVLDPSAAELPGPGDGLILLLYLFSAVPTLIVYAIYASIYALLARRKKSRSLASSTV